MKTGFLQPQKGHNGNLITNPRRRFADGWGGMGGSGGGKGTTKPNLDFSKKANSEYLGVI